MLEFVIEPRHSDDPSYHVDDADYLKHESLRYLVRRVWM
jgi:hypothetical protein